MGQKWNEINRTTEKEWNTESKDGQQLNQVKNQSNKKGQKANKQKSDNVKK